MKCFVFTCPLVCSFQAVSDIERNEWLDAIRIAILKGLDEERHVERGSVPSSHNILERICQNASNRTCADCNCDSECVRGGEVRRRGGRGGVDEGGHVLLTMNATMWARVKSANRIVANFYMNKYMFYTRILYIKALVLLCQINTPLSKIRDLGLYLYQDSTSFTANPACFSMVLFSPTH